MADKAPLKNVGDVFRTTKIWNHFVDVSKTNTKKKETVEDLVDYCVPILSRIVETFPTYTLHDGQHQLNILNKYEDLLGDMLFELNDLECAILILSAFFHDIGMVFDKEERANLKDEEYFDDFLKENGSARLMLEKKGEIDDELAEWYCRWSHAKRVWKYLNLDEVDEKLLWEGNNFRKELAKVCLSHNESTEYIQSDKLSNSFWTDCDLKFCAIILRLSDILDFDNTRSPESVFNFLKLNEAKTYSEQVSYQEWSKHLASRGFDFKDWSQEKSYTIYFKASPKHPAVENDIREFLDIIENELRLCSIALRSCSDRWNKFVLPEKIDRSNILSQGYTAGAFKFDLDQKQVLNLLMGENLYNNPYVFIRELLQNAIDTCRHREFHESNSGKVNFKSKSIEIKSWRDKDGFKWVRIDDFGMGMNLEQISKYFLKIGNSYYNSDEFKVRKLDYDTSSGIDFTPVSKFGIGILSCFMVSDLIEVSTKSVNTDRDFIYPIRLTLRGMNNYYFLYTGDDIPRPMPDEYKEVEGFRKDVGTSIAIRIKPNYDTLSLNIDTILESLIYDSPIPVFHKRKQYGKPLDLFNLPMEKVYKLTDKNILALEEYMNDVQINEFNPEVYIVPISLNQNYTHPNIRGIIYVVFLKVNITINSKKSLKIYSNYSWNLSYRGNCIHIQLRNEYKNIHILEMKLSSVLDDIPEFNNYLFLSKIRDKSLLIHNGIIIPNNDLSFFDENPKLNIYIKEKKSDASLTLAIISLADRLRPNLNLARNEIKSIKWGLYSHLSYTILKNLEHSDFSFIPFHSISALTVDGPPLDQEDAKNDELVKDINKWASILKFGKKELNIYQLNSLNAESYDIGELGSSKESILQKLVLKQHLKFKLSLKLFRSNDVSDYLKEDGIIYILKAIFIVIPILKDITLEYPDIPPFRFVSFENFEGLRPKYNDSLIDKFNINHKFSKWLMPIYGYLEKNYKNHLKQILNSSEAEKLNAILNNLKEILEPEKRPDFIIKEEDFTVDFDSLELLEEEE